MSDRYQLAAYLATLGTLCIVFVAALVAAALQPSLIGGLEAFGLGTITGGLIGVLRMPAARSAAANVETAGTVVQAAASPSPAGAGQAGSGGPAA